MREVRDALERQQGFDVEFGMSADAVVLPRAKFPLEEFPDAVLLDASLGPDHGHTELRRTKTGSPAPVLMIARGESAEERIECLDAGADDCLGRPFHPGELTSRVRALLRRQGDGKDALPPLEANGVRVVHASREVFLDGQPVPTTTVEFEILSVLMRSAGVPVSRDQLMEVLYHRKATAFDRSIDMHVSHLRRKLSADRVLIKTVRGAGYQFCLAAKGSTA